MSVRVLKRNYGDLATITAVPAPVTGLPASNLQGDRRAAVCRVMGTTLRLDVQFDRPRPVGVIVIARHNWTSTAKWKREVFPGPNWTGTKLVDRDYSFVEAPVALGSFVLGDGLLARNRYSDWQTTMAVDWVTTQPLAQSMRLTITDTDNTSGYLEASRFLFGDYVQPLVNMSWGNKLQWVDESGQTRTEGRSLRADAIESYRKITINLDYNKDSEVAALNELSRVNGRKKDIFISLYPGDTDPLRERDYQMVTKMPDVPTLSRTLLNANQIDLPFVES